MDLKEFRSQLDLDDSFETMYDLKNKRIDIKSEKHNLRVFAEVDSLTEDLKIVISNNGLDVTGGCFPDVEESVNFTNEFVKAII